MAGVPHVAWGSALWSALHHWLGVELLGLMLVCGAQLVLDLLVSGGHHGGACAEY